MPLMRARATVPARSEGREVAPDYIIGRTKTFRFGTMDEIAELQEKVTYLEKHVEEQDTEIYRLTRLLDRVSLKLEKLEGKLQQVENGSVGGDTMPADEKPPHY